MKFRKRPIEVQAVQWTGDNLAEVGHLTGSNNFQPINDLGRGPNDPAWATAEVYDRLHDKWIPLRTGDWVVRGVRGECWPVEQAVFAETYEPVGEVVAVGDK